MNDQVKYYRHFKGGKYKVLAIGQDSETLKKVVIYQALYGEMKMWVRPYDMFFGKVIKDGVEVERFKEISKEDVLRSVDDSRYLKHKHIGGVNGQKGGQYEDFYAVYQIVSCIARYKNSLNAVAFQTQLDDTFVDDLLIAHTNHNIYHQLKDTFSLKWTDGTCRSILSDFEHQVSDCKERDEDFALTLVFSDTGSNVVEIPSSINEYTNVEFFPHADDINQLFFLSESFKEALCQISAKGADSTDDELSDLAIVFLGVWRGINTNSGVRLSEIVEKAGRISNFNLSIYSDIEIKSGCKSILDAIDGFEYKILGRELVWSLGFVSGSCQWTVQLENEILSTCPTTKRAIVALLK